MGTGTKQLAGEQDILFGQGSVEQNRGGVNYSIKKINAALIPFSGDDETGDMVSLKEVIDTILGATSIDAVTEW